jgi:hypothetical protein
VQDAGRIGKCLDLCASLGINEFSFKALSKVIDMRSALGTDECMLTRIENPESFLVVRRSGSYMSPLIEIGDDLLWAFEKEAGKYTENPVIMDSNKIHIFSTKQGA